MLQREEEAFNNARWIKRNRALRRPKVSDDAPETSMPSAQHFGRVRLSALRQHGFPLDLTELMARERGLTVDTEGFETLMEEQRARARRAQKKSVIEVADTAGHRQPTFSATSTITPAPTSKRFSMLVRRRRVALNNSVLYAEMGGQVGDRAR